MLETANKRHPNIKLIYGINSIVYFLDVQIEKQHDSLITSVNQKSAAEPYVLPLKSDHPRHIFTNIIHGALLRAIQLTLLYNGYSIYNCIIC